jgi:NAD(P)-dependent dehydrogenase (short-subunit alcohol dehydrogenase family)
MTYDFSGKTAVVTGASRGLGEATARTLAADGARVVMVARSADKLRAIAADLPNDPLVVEADLGAPEGWRAAADAILAAAPEINILVNNAGVTGRQSLAKMTEDDLTRILTVNVNAVIMLTHALTESLVRNRGAVVNISSVSAFSGGPGQIAYSTSKGAINSFTRNASIDLGRFGVRINAVAPGVIDDGMWDTAFKSGVDRERTFEAMARLLPLEQRWGAAQDIADAVAFLASDKAGYITGQVLRVDGGMIV